MKYVDFVCQTVLLIFAVAVLVFILPDRVLPEAMLVPQFFVGVWQIISSVVSVLFKMRAYQLKKWHLFFASIFLVCLWAMPDISLPILMVPSWILAGYYYAITCIKTFHRKRKTGSFLPHISF
jgi:hypothetical protein